MLFIQSEGRNQHRFQIMSDLHLEVGRQYSTFHVPVRAPYLILAGDIGTLKQYDEYLSFLERQCRGFDLVCLVLGNHEFYGLSRAEGLRLARRMEQEECLQGRLKVLDRDRVDLSESLCVLGCTLHSRIAEQNRTQVESRLKDFRRIENWTVDLHNEEHDRDLEWLRKQIKLEESSAKRHIVVVTHHAPIRRGSSAPEHEENPCTDGFATDLLEENDELNFAEWWIFGHTHFTTQLNRNGINLVSNQRDYILKPEAPPNGFQSLFRFLSPSTRHSFDVCKYIEVETRR